MWRPRASDDWGGANFVTLVFDMFGGKVEKGEMENGLVFCRFEGCLFDYGLVLFDVFFFSAKK